METDTREAFAFIIRDAFQAVIGIVFVKFDLFEILSWQEKCWNKQKKTNKQNKRKTYFYRNWNIQYIESI